MSFKVYKSSAGSGKTFTLVKEYLALALATENHKRYKSIMAVTFTNKAANEMKERVITYLTAISSSSNLAGGEKLIRSLLLTELNISESELKARAGRTLKSILHEYADFNISTIDKFILKIIRSFSIDFQIPFNFDVEMDSDAILNLAVENVIASAGSNKETTQFLINYVSKQAENDENWNIKNTLINISGKLLVDEAQQYLAGIKKFKFQDFLAAKKQCDEIGKAYRKKIDNFLNEGCSRLDTAGLDASDFKGGKTQSTWKYFKIPVKDHHSKLASDTIAKNFEEESWGSTKAKGELSAQDQAALYEFYQKIEFLKSNQLPKVIAATEVSKNLFQLALINEIEGELNALKKENNFVHISEFNQRVADIVIQQPIPFIYERIGEKYKNYLIDEFQDTSELQWQNLMPLIENSLSYGDFNLVVGDVKQAIYRWRGGNVDQFQNLDNPQSFTSSDLVNERLTRIRSYLKADQLATNYRSLPTIVQFNNLFFESLLSSLSLDFSNSYYSDYFQQIGSTKTGGYAELTLFDANSEEESKDEYFLNECLSIISNAVSRGHQLKDIAIIARQNQSLKTIGEFLVKNNLPIISSGSLNLGKSAVLNFIMSVFKVVNTPDDFGAMLKIMAFLFDDEQLLNLQLSIFENKSTAYQKLQQLLDKEFEVQLPSIHNVGLYDAIEGIIRLFKLNKNDPFVQKFLDIVNALQENDNLEFITWWEEKKNKTYISSPEGVDAVKLMTVHKSKGLEFPVVIYPFANNDKSGNKSLIWAATDELDINIPYSLVTAKKELENSLLKKEYEEEHKNSLLDSINTVYVALTRASEELYILATDNKKKQTENISSLGHFFYPVTELLENSENKYFLGEKQSKTIKKEEKTTQNNFFVNNNSGWKSKIKLSYAAPSIWDVPLDSEDSFVGKDPRKYGNLVHSVFARLNNSNALDELFNTLIAEGLMESTTLPTIKQEVENVLQHPLIQSIWNQGEHIIEQEIITKNGKSYRPDRIVKLNNTTHLLDFKTGEQKEKDKQQVRHYASLLSDLGHKNIQEHLVYLNPTAVVSL